MHSVVPEMKSNIRDYRAIIQDSWTTGSITLLRDTVPRMCMP